MPAEVDLGRGINDVASLGTLAEGPHVVRVVAVSGSGVASVPTSAVVRVDATRPRVELLAAPSGWVDGPVRLTARATDALSGMAASGPGGPATAIAVDGAVPRSEPGPTATIAVSGEGIHEVAAFARDAAGNSSAGSPTLSTVSIDESPPMVAFVRSQDPADPERIEATIADSLSGPSSKGGSVAVRPAGTRQRWQPLPTATLGGRLVARWDSDSFAPGSYEFRATAYGGRQRRRLGAARQRCPHGAEESAEVADPDRRRAGGPALP